MYVSGLALTLHEELQTTKKYIWFGFYSNSGDNCLFSVTEALLNSLIQLASVKRTGTQEMTEERTRDH